MIQNDSDIRHGIYTCHKEMPSHIHFIYNYTHVTYKMEYLPHKCKTKQSDSHNERKLCRKIKKNKVNEKKVFG